MTEPSKDNNFAPPTAEQVARHLERHPPRPPSRLAAWGPLLVLGALLAVTLVSDHPLVLVLPWLALIGLFVYLSWRVRRARELERRVLRIQEMAMLRQFRRSLRTAWKLLPNLTHMAELHARVVAYTAMNLDQLKAYDPAIVAYDYLIDRLPEQHPGSVQLRIQRAIAQLLSDQLTDADETLRRLRGVMAQIKGTAAGAAYRLAGLIQQVRTYHFDEAVQQSHDLVEGLRPLGIDAGYGHALVALSHHKLGQAAGESETAHADGEAIGDVNETVAGLPIELHREKAVLWWGRATTLVPPARLYDRFNELRDLAELGAAAASSADAPPDESQLRPPGVPDALEPPAPPEGGEPS